MPSGVVGVAAAGQLSFGQLGLSRMEQRLFARRLTAHGLRRCSPPDAARQKRLRIAS